MFSSNLKKTNGEKPKVVACHAGLECGILGQLSRYGYDFFWTNDSWLHIPLMKSSVSSSQKF
jgi:dipeptidase D